MSKRINLNVRLEGTEGLLDGAVIRYYQKLQSLRGQLPNHLSSALVGYWEIMAEDSLSLLTSTEEKRSRLEHNLLLLRQQINYLQDRFDVDYNSTSGRQLVSLQRQSRNAPPSSIEFEYRYQVSSDSIEGKIVQWLASKESGLAVSLHVMWASVGFWGAVACEEEGLLTWEQLQRCAANCIYRLEEQIDYLKNTYTPIIECPTPSSQEYAHQENGDGLPSSSQASASDSKNKGEEISIKFSQQFDDLFN